MARPRRELPRQAQNRPASAAASRAAARRRRAVSEYVAQAVSPAGLQNQQIGPPGSPRLAHIYGSSV